jgi:hypothetical protein
LHENPSDFHSRRNGIESHRADGKRAAKSAAGGVDATQITNQWHHQNNNESNAADDFYNFDYYYYYYYGEYNGTADWTDDEVVSIIAA